MVKISRTGKTVAPDMPFLSVDRGTVARDIVVISRFFVIAAWATAFISGDTIIISSFFVFAAWAAVILSRFFQKISRAVEDLIVLSNQNL